MANEAQRRAVSAEARAIELVAELDEARDAERAARRDAQVERERASD